MNNYETQNIEYPELQTYLRNLHKLSTYDFSKSSYEKIYNEFFDLALTIPSLGAKLDKEGFNGFELYRVRMEKTISKSENMNSIKTFSFPPSSICNSNGRANIKKRSVFYCTDEMLPAIKESEGNINDIGFLGIWEVQSNRNLKYMSCLPEALPKSNGWEEFGRYHHNFLIDEQVKENQDLLAYKVALRKLITDKFMMEKKPYSISSMLANEYLYETDNDFILYSSIQTQYDYTNFAFHPKSVINHLKCRKIIKFKINDIKDGQFVINISMIGEAENNRLYWKRANDEDCIELGFNKI